MEIKMAFGSKLLKGSRSPIRNINPPITIPKIAPPKENVITSFKRLSSKGKTPVI
jgi:hypothetical protein